jgi:hypothetical protein
MPVNAACGVLSAALLLGMQGIAAFVMWTEWKDKLPLYLVTCTLFAIAALGLVALSLRADGTHRAALRTSPRPSRSIAIGIVLGVALGGLLLSSAYAFDLNELHFGSGACAVGWSAALGMLAGMWLVRQDQRPIVQPEPHLARMLGGLVGANLAATLVAGPWAVFQHLNGREPYWALAGLLVAAAWSGAVCAAKTRLDREPVRRARSVLVVATDGLTGGGAVVLVLLAMRSSSEFWWLAGASLTGIAVWTVLAMLCKRKAKWWWDGDEQAPRCMHCGYNLTGLADPRCPECGEPFDEELVRRLARIPVFPISFWHPLSTSPVGGGLVGVSVWLLVVLVIAGYEWLW